MKSLLNRHRHLTALVLLLLIGAAVWLLKSAEAHTMEAAIWAWIKEAHEWLKLSPPIVFFSAAGILPMVGVPIVGFYLLASGIYEPQVALLWLIYSIILNLLLSYAAGRICHKWITLWLAKSGRSIPQIPRQHRLWMTAAVRVMPGAPLLVQNYLLVLAGVPLLPFVLISVPIELLIASGYVLIGHSLFTGNWQMGLIAVIVVVIGIFVIRDLRRRTTARKDVADAAAGLAAGAASRSGTQPDAAAAVPCHASPYAASADAPACSGNLDGASRRSDTPDAAACSGAPDAAACSGNPAGASHRSGMPDAVTCSGAPDTPATVKKD